MALIRKSPLHEERVVLKEKPLDLSLKKLPPMPNLDIGLTTFEYIKLLYKQSKLTLRLTYYIIKLFGIMENQKTTSLGNKKLYTTIATIIVTVLSLFLDLSPEVQTAVTTSIVSVGVIIREFFSGKQAKETKDA